MSEFIQPTNPEDIKKIRQAVEEGSSAMQFIDDKRAFIRDVVAHLHDEFTVPKKIASSLIRTHFKNNYSEVTHESDVFQLLHEMINLKASDND